MGSSDTILDVQDLHVRFPVFGGVISRKKGEVRAVDGVSLTLRRGETIGLVGESGCGKTTVGRAIVNILRAMNYRVEISGRVLYHRDSEVVDLASLKRAGMRRYRSDLQMVFQDPYSSLNPRMTVGTIIEEPLKIHTTQSRAERRDRVHWLLEKVRLSPAHASRYPPTGPSWRVPTLRWPGVRAAKPPSTRWSSARMSRPWPTGRPWLRRWMPPATR